MTITTQTEANTIAPSGDVGTDAGVFTRMVNLEWLARLTMVGGAASTYLLWGRRGGVWGQLGTFMAGASLPTDTTYWSTLSDLRFFDRIYLQCTAGGPTSYVFTLEEAQADG